MSKRETLTNYYETPLAKRLLGEKEVDKQVDKTGIPLDSMVGVIGGTGAGKSQALVNFLDRSSGCFSHVYILTKAEEDLYSILAHHIGEENLSVFYDYKQMPRATDFDQQLAAPGKKKVKKLHSVVVLDDCCCDKSQDFKQFVNHYFQFGRKRYLTVIYLSQSFFDMDIFVRKQLHYLLICGKLSNDDDIKRILRQYASIQLDVDTLKQMYLFAVSKRFPKEMCFFKICCSANGDPAKQLSRNFTDYIVIPNESRRIAPLPDSPKEDKKRRASSPSPEKKKRRVE